MHNSRDCHAAARALAKRGDAPILAAVCAGPLRSGPDQETTHANKRPLPQPGILDISPYVPGESNVPGGVKPIKLSSNETPLGPSPKAIAAYKAEAEQLERYPDGGATALRNAIARHYGLNPDRIVCGCGSDELINLIAHAYVGPGDEAVYTEHGFLMYKIATLSSGGKPVPVPEKDYRADVDAILARVDAPRPRSSSSPIPTIRPAPTCPTTRCGACTRACRATRCWCWTRPIASTCAATTTRRGWSWSPPPRTR